nr:immunoglobulin light chain junction region [Macaca mulatta]MOW09582.1 immunoglobulin light chain junction region [Macaca mulatta]MOW11964.1 immunoglobulin light chain junction region [Macaca mulatta]MOW13040.1 immunoglobulin light chain junction region [Macaca mulatta]MOW13372.1 immunoglobulin light chain junction region [Macaca mulatta]
CQKYINSPLTF